MAQEKNALALYEITLAGFNGGTDETDHLVIWIAAPNGKMVKDAIVGTGARYWGKISDELESVDFQLPEQAAELAERIANPEAASAPSP